MQGWLLADAVEMLLRAFDVQTCAGIRGAACEIGVHHGRLFILLALATRADELAVAYDLFDHQDENVDRSGHGSLVRLLENAKVHDCDGSRIKPIAINSLSLTPDRIVADCGQSPRLFSIDGGHTANVTFNDLDLAAETVCEGGLVILDDFFNPDWPGVAEGACRFLLARPESLRPVAIGGNKVLLTTDANWAATYAAALRRLSGDYVIKDSIMFGQPVLIVHKNGLTRAAALFQRARASRSWQALRTTPAGRLLRWINRQAHRARAS